MTQEEIELLIKDLCARSPYDVQGITSEGVTTPLLHRGEADWDILTSLNYRIVKHGWRPYLRTMSSMTDEELKEFAYTILQQPDLDAVRNWQTLDIELRELSKALDWLNKKMFDYHGLIPMGLALKSPEGRYNTN